MTRLIDADQFMRAYRIATDRDAISKTMGEVFLLSVEIWVKNCQVDAVPVIRCKDCIYWQDNQKGHYPHPDCKWNNDETPDADDYCSNAVRKEK